jgi:tetratricopeptide (TPR) repeat protein
MTLGSFAATLKNISQTLTSQRDRSEESSLYFRRACLAAAEERWDIAIVFCGKAIEADGRNLTARLLLARIHDRALGNVDAAVAGYRKVIALAGYDSRDPRCRMAREALDALVQRT